MVVLPRFTYLFQSIPSCIPQSYFKKLDSILTAFIWQYKVVRIGKKHLCKAKYEGGFALPNLRCYYWAAHLNILAFWRSGILTEGTEEDTPAWLSMERAACLGTSLPALLNSPVKNKLLNAGNYLVHNSLKIWKQIKTYFKAPNMYIDRPIRGNHTFKSASVDSTFARWKEKGVECLKDLYQGGHLMSFEQLRNKYDPPASHYRSGAL